MSECHHGSVPTIMTSFISKGFSSLHTETGPIPGSKFIPGSSKPGSRGMITLTPHVHFVIPLEGA